MEIPPTKSAILAELLATLKSVPNMAAITLGGSYARGTARPDSDLDIGLYYFPDRPFSIERIREIARKFSSRGEPTVTDFYEWGPFVNGGAWIENDVSKVDFLYRNTDQLTRAIAEAEEGIWTHSFDQQPPFGFRSVTTLGEIQCCKPLYDPAGWLAAQKRRVSTYPPKLKGRIVQDTLWGAEFSFFFAEKFAADRDVPSTVACMTRIYHYLVQALFALNETYFISDKRVLDEIANLTRRPKDFGARASEILAHAGAHAEQLDHSLRKLEMLFHETVLLAEGSYTPRFTPPKTQN